MLRLQSDVKWVPLRRRLHALFFFFFFGRPSLSSKASENVRPTEAAPRSGPAARLPWPAQPVAHPPARALRPPPRSAVLRPPPVRRRAKPRCARLHHHAQILLTPRRSQRSPLPRLPHAPARPPPDAFVFPILVKNSASGALEPLHGRVLRLGHCADPYIRNAIMDAYAKRGAPANAQKVFEEAPQRTAADWNAMVSGYWHCGDEAEARRMFDAMPAKNVVSWTAMVTGYCKIGEPEKARVVFDAMPERTVVSWNAMLSGYAQNGLAEAALKEIFDAMGRSRNSVSWNAMISGYCREGDLAIARQLFDEMPRRNVISWNSMISGYVQNGQWGNALELFNAMEEEVKPDDVTMASVLSACGHLGALENGRRAAEIISREKIRLGLSGHNALVFMHSRCGSMAEARRVFQEMPTRDVVSYNSLITGLAAHGHGSEAVALLRRMKEEGVDPDRITFLGILTACSHGGLAAQGREVFSAIGSPTVDHYACMVDLLGRAGELDAAAKLVAEMPVAPHAGVYGALLHASRIHRRVDLGELAAEKLFALEPDNAGNYVLLANIYAAARRWEDVEKVREAMQRSGVRKTTACSWVELRGEIHRFTAGDQSHPKGRRSTGCCRSTGRR
ncbi:unnamed protein product [Spirodela intermedia]|uniref:Uncharacterized protein n=1 Tax=Spirodela intermedia TaxID=51605 RepID=A0A7I8JC92_SPIIN|nr:unnamed protein product [Spirodela intermedia]CAA6667766.1 unnamed protein product [Spirodela intermedia]